MTKRMPRVPSAMTVAVLVLVCTGVADVQSRPAGGAVVLDTAGVWRMYHTLKPPLLQTTEGGREPLLLNVKWLDGETPPPPADWTRPEMNDREWMRGPARRCARTPYLARLSLRGKFAVTNPSAAGPLSLAVEYHGGAIVCLNGKEIGRGHLPAAKDASDVTAEAYPTEAFLDASGHLIPDAAQRTPGDIRTRSMNIALSNDLLRKGVNVLAIDIVRAPYPAVLLDKKPRGVGGPSSDPGVMWNTCEILTVRLSAGSADGLVPNASRPEGLQVWNTDTLAGDVDADYGDRTEPLAPVALSGPRNGDLYGKVVIGCDKPIKDLQVTASELKSADSTIASSAVSFLYGIRGGSENLPRSDPIPPYPYGTNFLLTLVSEPLKEFPAPAGSRPAGRPAAAVVPLWVRVKVPKGAKPGVYKGAVTIAAADAPPVQAPVELKVLPWTIADPQDFRTWVELIQSPDTLSLEYGTPLWSQKHFDLIAKSFDAVSNTGARSLYVPAIAHTNLGNAESMIRWIQKPGGPNGAGAYAWDFSVMDKYLDVAQKHLGTPKLVVLQVWEVYMNTKGESTGRRFGEILDENQKNTGGAPLVTFVGEDGNTWNGTIPKLSDAASKAIWRDLLAQVRERLKKRGLEKTLQLGMFTDSTPNKEDTRLFLDIAPDLPWVQQGHNAFESLHGIAQVGYTATWWSQRFADDLVNRRSGAVGKATYRPHATAMTSLHGWNRPRKDAYYPRMTNETHPLSYWRFLCELAITGDFHCGIGRVGADYWPVVKAKDGRRTGWVNERFQEVVGYLHDLHSYLLEPGADGPLAMARLIAVQQGVQECEARIYIEDALLNKDLAKRAPDLAKRCQEALDERLACMWRALNNWQCGGWGVTAWRFQAGVSGHAWLLNAGLRERTEKLYALAGEVERQLAPK
jgi:hypothetical protein